MFIQEETNNVNIAFKTDLLKCSFEASLTHDCSTSKWPGDAYCVSPVTGP